MQFQALLSMEFLGNNIGISSLSLLQMIFSTQGSKPYLLHYRQILYCLSYQGSPEVGHIFRSLVNKTIMCLWWSIRLQGTYQAAYCKKYLTLSYPTFSQLALYIWTLPPAIEIKSAETIKQIQFTLSYTLKYHDCSLWFPFIFLGGNFSIVIAIIRGFF